ncbi:hypothetical protein KSF_060360 [Reticulibacter mediterranei]|uniref:Uncharacterized protein n=1 Tax=Reticulibacter mediterranei TaxID=2778369 RepID=A0A8J3ILF0_9CHLR|nr:hypothetical protein KSF_060360 [Reticulibacter mediterranei]
MKAVTFEPLPNKMRVPEEQQIYKQYSTEREDYSWQDSAHDSHAFPLSPLSLG